MGFIKKTTSIFSTGVLLFFLQTITSILVARILGPAGKGVLVLIFLVPSLLLVVSNLGLSVANIYFIGKKKDRIEEIVSNSFVLSVILGILFILLFSITFPKLYPLFFKGIKPYYFFLAVSTLPITLFNSYCGSILLAKEKIKEVNLLSIIPAVGYLVFFLTSILIVKQYIIGATISQILAAIVATTCAIFWIKKIAKIRFKFYPTLIKKYMNFGLKAYIANSICFLNYRLDMFLVAYFLTIKDVGYYSLAVGLAELLWYIPNSISTILYPRISASERKEANELTPITCRHTLFLVGLASLGLLLFGRLIIKIAYGTVYLPSLRPLLILIPGILALSLGKVLSCYITGQGRPIVATYTSFIVFAVNMSLNLFLIPKWGIAGAAFASTVAYSLATGIGLVVFLKMSANKLWKTLIIKKEDLQIYKDVLSKIFVSVGSGKNKLKGWIIQNI